MRIIYKKSIVEEIDQAIFNAINTRKQIKCIELTEKEFNELKDMMIHSGKKFKHTGTQYNDIPIKIVKE